MLFSSPEFIYAFLPLVFLGFALSQRLRSPAAGMYWLIASSLFFYGWWNPRYLVLICVLIAVNYALARVIGAAQGAHRRKAWLVIGLAINIGTLVYYKYAGFLIHNVNVLAGTHLDLGTIVLPLGISFFTFQKIAFLVDTYQGRVKRISVGEYSLFVLFFPQLIAGPIVHHAEVVPQFRELHKRRVDWDNVAVGLSLFFVGLFKKVVFADSLSAYLVNPVFSKVTGGAAPEFLEAWGAVLGYTLQLYFDFSGYSDMAIGAAQMFGIRLPQNFNSPYKARSIIDFWRRWHMTLSRFLREYLYIAMGGNRLGPARRYLNLFITMVIGGIWHGAGWTFVIWGTLHGAYLTVNHAWRAVLHKSALDVDSIPKWLRTAGSGLLTYLAVVVGWVFFKSDSVTTAGRLLRTMFGGDPIRLPESVARLPLVGALLGHMVQFVPAGAAYGQIRGSAALLFVFALVVWCWLLPNPQQLFAAHRSALGTEHLPQGPAWTRFRFDWRWATLVSGVIVVCLLYVQSNIAQDFLYFDF